MTHGDLFITWLNDAYTLETSVADTLVAQIELAANLPMVQKRLRNHLEETREHARIIRSCLEMLGASVGGGNEVLAFPAESRHRAVARTSEDDLVRSAMMALSVESLEIATYTALIVAANELGHTGMASRFEAILAQERAMVDWIEEDLPLLASEALIRVEGWDHSLDSVSGE